MVMTDLPRLKRQIDSLERTLNVLDALVSTLDVPTNIKSALQSIVRNLSEGVADIKGDDPELSAVEIPSFKRVTVSDELHFKELSLYPDLQEVSVGNVRKRLPLKEFSIIYNLASNANMPVKFENTTSLQTHLSGLRRHFPKLKQLISTQGGGVYLITLTK